MSHSRYRVGTDPMPEASLEYDRDNEDRLRRQIEQNFESMDVHLQAVRSNTDGVTAESHIWQQFLLMGA